MKQLSYMSEMNRLERLSDIGDPLDRMRLLDWEFFRKPLEDGLRTEPRGPGGRPPIDKLLLFKMTMLSSWYGLSDEKTEFMVNDRLSFQRFLGLDLNDRVPDAKTLWLFKEGLKVTGLYRELKDQFVGMLTKQGIVTKEGSLVDASFAEVPKQRNTRRENKTIKEGGVPGEWLEEGNAYKLEQKDLDARWTKKNGKSYYGYKNHIKVDKDSKIITDCIVTAANVHDSQCFEELLDENDRDVWADSAYTGKALHGSIESSYPEIVLNVNEKGNKNNPLTETQLENNKTKSRIRARVEHVFGHMAQAMAGLTLRCIGIWRAERDIFLRNLGYNLQRLAYLKGLPVKGKPQ